MEHLRQKHLKQISIHRNRGMIVYVLYQARPKWLELSTLISLLDSLNLPFTSGQLAKKIDFLRSAGLVRVRQAGGKSELTGEEQETLIERCFDADGEMDDEISIRITEKGVNFQENVFDVQGISRVN